MGLITTDKRPSPGCGQKRKRSTPDCNVAGNPLSPRQSSSRLGSAGSPSPKPQPLATTPHIETFSSADGYNRHLPHVHPASPTSHPHTDMSYHAPLNAPIAYNVTPPPQSAFPRQHDRSNASSSPDPEANLNANGKPKHSRSYQACEPCRERKVKCDMGDVDNPSAGPCKKCAREKKNCWFSETRRKGKGEQPSSNPAPSSQTPDIHVAKRPRTSTSSSGIPNMSTILPPPPNANAFAQNNSPIPSPAHYSPHSPALSSLNGRQPSMPYSSQPRSMPNVFPSPNGTYNSPPMRNTNGFPSVLPASVAPRSNQQDDHLAAPSIKGLARPFTNTSEGMNALVNAALSTGNSGDAVGRAERARALTGRRAEPDLTNLTQAQREAWDKGIEVWKQMKLVRAGWITAHEAIELVRYYYEKLEPMTPVKTQDYRDPSTHLKLLKEEPVLALSILAISSRYFVFKTLASQSRNFSIHERLWDSLRKMIQRLFWGQEQFGGGFCGGGMVPTRETITGQITWTGSLRTLGTIEALLLLTEWQPRALHFPPGDDDNKLLADDSRFGEEDNGQDSRHDNLPFSVWLEPAWRADRMAWMLLGIAQALAYELGVFDKKYLACTGNHDLNSECVQKRRLRRLLVTFIAQISGRIGIKTSLDPSLDDPHGEPEMNKVEATQKLWFDIATMMNDVNSDIFVHSQYTADLIHSGGYKKAIDNFTPRLRQWWDRFQSLQDHLDPQMKLILRMEYEYARMYTNSLGMQKVVEQMVIQNTESQSHRVSTQNMYAVILENKDYTEEVRDAAKNILEAIGDMAKLKEKECLRDAPVRTFLRSMSGMMFQLKLLSLGNPAPTVKRSLRLLVDTTNQMINNVVDDVHLAPGTASLIRKLTEAVKGNLVRVPNPGSRGASRQLSPHTTYSAEEESPDTLADLPFADITNQSFIPPPGFDSTYDAMEGFDAAMQNSMMPGLEDWIVMPFEGLVAQGPNSVNMVNQGFGGIGPTVGDRDMLSLMTGSTYDQSGGLPSNFNQFNYGNGY